MSRRSLLETLLAPLSFGRFACKPEAKRPKLTRLPPAASAEMLVGEPLPQWECSNHGPTDRTVNFSFPERSTNVTFCIDCVIDALKESGAAYHDELEP